MTSLGQIGPFALSEILGQGGMATVYLAQHPQFGRVALRVIRKDASKLQSEIVEAERTGAYQHIMLSESGCPCVPKAYPIYEDPDGRYFCVPVEYIDGETLAHKIERAPVTEAEAIRIAIEVCRNLECAHQFRADLGNGRVIDHVVHGDIKPANIMVSRQNEIKVLDYGISKPILDEKSATRQVFGAACYSSPERLEDKKFDLHTDLWAVGIVLYELVSGHRPFEGNEVEIRQAFREGRRPPPLHGVSAGYQAIVRKMLFYDRSRRYPSATAVIADLERLRQGQSPYALNDSYEQDDRTVRVSADTLRTADATVRREPLRGPEAPHRPPAPAAARSQAVLMVLLALLGAGVAFGGYVGWHEYRLVQEAAEFSRELEGKSEITLKDWNTYRDIAARSWTRVPTLGPARLIRQRYKEYAARAIREYREGLSRALSGQRRQTAEMYLQRALELDSSDREARAMLLTMQAFGLPLSNRENGRKAMELFEQAAHLDGRSPDPYLGIARVSVYALRDAERAASALDQAKERGYAEVDRDRAMLADGYRYQAADLWAGLRRIECEAIDKKRLRRVRKMLEQSIDLYERVPQFAGAQSGLESAHVMLADMKKTCNPSSWWRVWERF